MHRSLALASLLLVAGSAGTIRARADVATTERHFFISVSVDQCELEEAGRLADPDRPDESKLRLGGTLSELDPHVFRCVVGLQRSETAPSLTACRLTGFQHASVHFFRGDPRTLVRSCSVRRLSDGTLEFQASGIAADQCDFSCDAP